MNIQNIIVAVIILAACFYVGQILWRRARSFSSKSSCAADCGCESKQKSKTAKV